MVPGGPRLLGRGLRPAGPLWCLHRGGHFLKCKSMNLPGVPLHPLDSPAVQPLTSWRLEQVQEQGEQEQEEQKKGQAVGQGPRPKTSW